MKLRIDGQELRFRISKQELEHLCNGTVLQQQTHLPDSRALKVSIITVDRVEELLHLTHEKDHMQLQADKERLTAFRDSLPNREGLECNQAIENGQNLCLILEVDIRSQKRQKD